MNTIRTNFDKELTLLYNDLVKMASLIEESIQKSIVVIRTHDEVLADEIIVNDKEINAMEKSIENRCLTLLLRQQPVASDLRLISAALKMITDMERIGDHAKDISEIVKLSNIKEISSYSEDLADMAEKAIGMVKDSITAFIRKDERIARETIQKDDAVDELFIIVKSDLTETIKKGANADDVLDAMMICKYLERIADHAVNICEWVIYLITGEHTNTDDFKGTI
ncbi:MAG: phosphate signaling complex protein PhoU [Anaerofustis sp.]